MAAARLSEERRKRGGVSAAAPQSMATLTKAARKNNSPVKCSILLAVLNDFESGKGCEITGDVEAMQALGIRDVESLESYLEAKFHFEHFDEDSLKNLFDSLLVLFPNDDLLPVPVDAETWLRPRKHNVSRVKCLRRCF